MLAMVVCVGVSKSSWVERREYICNRVITSLYTEWIRGSSGGDEWGRGLTASGSVFPKDDPEIGTVSEPVFNSWGGWRMNEDHKKKKRRASEREDK